MLIPVLIAVAVVGLFAGSVAELLIRRIPSDAPLLPVSWPCPACNAPRTGLRMLPLVGALATRGRCTDCHARLGLRRPAVELLTAALFVAITVRLLDLHRPALLPAYLYLASVGLALATIDIALHRLPNAIVLPSYPIMIVLLTVGGLASHDAPALIRALIGGAALYAFYLLLLLIYPSGMGFGDVKLAGILGGALACLGWSTLLIGAFGGFLLAALAGIVVIVTGRGTGKTAIAFGPFMIAGALIGILAGPQLAGAYVGLLNGGAAS